MGVFLEPKKFSRALRPGRRDVPAPGRTADATCRLTLGWRASDARHGSGADDGSVGAPPRRAVAPACRRRSRTRCSSGATGSTRPAISIVMVEQNASRCLQICHRGYVLDQGQNAYTGTGKRTADRPEGDRALPRHAGQDAPETERPGCVRPRRSLSETRRARPSCQDVPSPPPGRPNGNGRGNAPCGPALPDRAAASASSLASQATRAWARSGRSTGGWGAEGL